MKEFKQSSSKRTINNITVEKPEIKKAPFRKPEKRYKTNMKYYKFIFLQYEPKVKGFFFETNKLSIAFQSNG